MAKRKKKGKKIRVEFRKNRENRTRRNDLTREALDQGIENSDFVQSERVSGKGNISRHRTIIGEGEDGEDIVRSVDESRCEPGVVLRAVGLNSIVETPAGRHYECTLRRIVRTLARDGRNAVVAGDRVLFQPTAEEHGVIERVEPRRTVLSRSSGRQEHVLVSNVDQALIVASVGNPPLKPHLIDRFLISAEKGNVRPIICINKADLVNATNLQPLAGMYARLGYSVVLTSALDGHGIKQLRHLMKDRQTVLSGQSGVGKTSLINAIQPGLKLDTGEVSEWNHKGKHTTRRAELLKLNHGGWVVDTPGIRQMELWDVQPEEMEYYFIEFRPFVTYCKFPDCSHLHEDKCGVKEAVNNHFIADQRYQSYQRLMVELGPE